MPYATIEELPDSVRDSLPEHAQEVYKEAFNSAWSQYADPDGQSGEAGREETAHRVAWRAVERTNKKGADERWEKLD
jgi:cation transport regulator